jgi:hypothetical protein
MPTVPLYQDTQQRVALRAEYSENFTTRADADAFGAGIGRGMQALGKGMETAATNLNEAAALRLKKLDDETAAKEAQTNFSNWKRNALHGTGGFLSLSGKAAIAAGPEVVKQSQKARDDFGKDLSPDARTQYEQQTQDDQTDVEKTSIDHSMDARRENVQEVYNDRVRSLTDDIVVNFGNPEKEAQSREFLDNEIEYNGILNNKSPEEIDNDKQRIHFDLNRQIAEDLATKDPIGIHKIISENPDFLREEDKSEVLEHLKPLLIEANSENQFIAIASDIHMPNGYVGTPSDPYIQDEMHTVVRPEIFRDTLYTFTQNITGDGTEPNVTPWSTEIVNNVFGLPVGVGKQNISAKAFRLFGNATDSPKTGDIVVTNDENQEVRVGFFQGYDKDGNILVLGKHAEEPSHIAVKGVSPERLISFRTAGNVDSRTLRMANYSLQGLSELDRKADGISDPDVRAATRKKLENYYTGKKANVDNSRDETMQSVMKLIEKQPEFDPNKMSLENQIIVGRSGMKILNEYAERVRLNANVKTNEHQLYKLNDLFAKNPEAFKDIDLYNYRLKLSDSDWKEVLRWKELSQRHPEQARLEGLELNRAFNRARQELTGVGIVMDMARLTDEQSRKIPVLQNAIVRELRAIKAQRKEGFITDADVIITIRNKLMEIYNDN